MCSRPIAKNFRLVKMPIKQGQADAAFAENHIETNKFVTEFLFLRSKIKMMVLQLLVERLLPLFKKWIFHHAHQLSM